MSVKWLCLDFKQSFSTKIEFHIHILKSLRSHLSAFKVLY